MPHNSQSPLVLRLNDLFKSPGLLPDEYLAVPVSAGGQPLARRARDQQVALNDLERKHIDDWPKDQQDMVRDALLLSIQDGLPISFAWEKAPVTRTIVVSFGTKLGITARSPRKYPPYTEP